MFIESKQTFKDIFVGFKNLLLISEDFNKNILLIMKRSKKKLKMKRLGLLLANNNSKIIMI